MKKITLTLFALVITLYGAHCQSVTYSFSWMGSNSPSCNPFVTENNYISPQADLSGGFTYWKATHGSPSLASNQGQYNIGILNASYDFQHGTFSSEGLFINAPFSEGYYYSVEVGLRKTSGYIGLSIYAANNLTERTGTGCIEESVQTLDNNNKQLIKAVGNVGNSGLPGEYTSISENFLALKNFSSIWLYSTSDIYRDSENGSINILDIYISKGYPETEPPSQPNNLTMPSTATNGFTANWTESNDNVRVVGYEVWVDGALNKTVTSTSCVLSGLTTNQIHIVKVRAYDPVKNYSEFSNEVPIFVVPTLNINGSTSFCNGNSETFSTTSYSNATYQWSVGSGLSLNGTTSPTVKATANALYNGKSTISLTRTLIKGGFSDTRSTQITVEIGAPLRPYINNGSVTSTTVSVSYELTWGSPTTSLQLFFIPQSNSPSANWVVEKALSSSCFELVENEDFVYVNPTGVGTGSITVKGENSCGVSSTTNIYLTIRRSGGIKDPIELPKLDASNILLTNTCIYPNPTNGIVNIELPKSNTENSLFEIKVFDMLGKLILSKSSIIDNSKQSIDLSQYNNGNYIILISNNDGVVEKQLINLSK